MLFNMVTDMMTEFLEILVIFLFVITISVFIHLIGSKKEFTKKEIFSKYEKYVVISVIFLDIILLLLFVVQPTYDFIIATYTYQEYLEMLVLNPDSSLYNYLQWILVRMSIMAFLGVEDETKLLKGGLIGN